SNLGVRELNEEARIGFRLQQEGKQTKAEFLRRFQQAKKRILEEVKKFFPPEFLNRLDKIIVFNPLTLDEVKKIVRLQLRELKERLKARRLKLKIEPKVIDFLAEKGFNPQYGARPILRLITREIEDKISEGLLLGKIKERDTVLVRKPKGKKHLEVIPQREKITSP
ncbi:ATP-dependent Clp protease ATP-binding subunit, partial [bacterium]|nr:ATP-dependent Clp protease ATP-binding subunit [bacterium]